MIGTLAERAAREGVRTIVSTGDKDLAQLVNDHVTLVNTMTTAIAAEDLQRFFEATGHVPLWLDFPL